MTASVTLHRKKGWKIRLVRYVERMRTIITIQNFKQKLGKEKLSWKSGLGLEDM